MKRECAALAAIFLLAASIFGQVVEDRGRRTIGYIWKDGVVEDGGRKTLGYIGQAGIIEDAGRKTILKVFELLGNQAL